MAEISVAADKPQKQEKAGKGSKGESAKSANQGTEPSLATKSLAVKEAELAGKSTRKAQPRRQLASKVQEKSARRIPRELLGLQTNFYSTDPQCLPKRNAFKVMFSNCAKAEEYTKQLGRLGARVVEDIFQSFNVLVMDSFKRRIKVLVALNKKAWVVSSAWVKDCIEENRLLDPDSYILEIGEKEEYHGAVDMKESVYAAMGEDIQLFEGLSFYLPADGGFYTVSQKEMEYLIESGGGKVLQSQPSEFKENAIILINDKFKPAHDKYALNNESKVFLYSQELVLMGCLTRALDLEKYILNEDAN